MHILDEDRLVFVVGVGRIKHLLALIFYYFVQGSAVHPFLVEKACNGKSAGCFRFDQGVLLDLA